MTQIKIKASIISGNVKYKFMPEDVFYACLLISKIWHFPLSAPRVGFKK